MRILFLVILLSFNIINASTKKAPNILNIKTKNLKKSAQLLKSLNIEILGINYQQKEIDVLAFDKDIAKLQKSNINYKLDSNKKIKKVLDDGYKTPTEIENIFKQFHKNFPEITHLQSIGKSVENRDIWALKISDNAKNIENEPRILFNALHHAREVMTPEIIIDIAEQLLTNYSKSKIISNWVNNNEIWLVPMLNVDGSAKIWRGNTWWRKNLGYKEFGVDLNRNYPHNWGACNGSSDNRYSDTFRGPEPSSEPETKALMNLVNTIRPVFSISYHAYSELVLYPYSCEGEYTGIKEIIEHVGSQLASKVNYVAGTPWEILYSADGVDMDWMYAEAQVIPFVLEINSSKEGFQPDYDKWRDKTVIRNRPAWQHLLNGLEGPGIRGIVNSKNMQNSEITISVSKIENKGNKFIKDYDISPEGIFHIILLSGDYKVSIKKDGTIISHKNITISNSRIDLNFEL